MLRLPCGQCSASSAYSAGSAGSNVDGRAVLGRDRDDDGARRGDAAAVGVHGDGRRRRARCAATVAPSTHPIAELLGHPQRDLLGAAGEAVLLRAALDVEHRPDAARGLDVAHGVQHRHLVGFAAPRHPRHDRHQVAGAMRPRAPTAATRRASVRRGARRSATSTARPAGPACSSRSNRHWMRDDVEQLEDRQLRDGAAVGAHPAAPADQVLAVVVGRHRRAAELGGELEHRVLRRADERAAEVDGHAGDRGGGRPAADAVTALEHDDVAPASDQFACRGQPGEPGAHDDDVSVAI